MNSGGIEGLDDLRRTHYCGNVGSADVGARVTVMGWVANRRDLGDLIFIDVRDRTGLVQVVSDAGSSPGSYKAADKVRGEYVVAVTGVVEERRPGSANPTLKTGEIEIASSEIRILNVSKTPPFYVKDDAGADELLRLKHRYLDIRRPITLKSLEMYHKTMAAVRQFLDKQGFWDVGTPLLTRSTPEGARDYLVPSRVSPGKFYALAQSPQLFKQLLMVGGVDKYFQIAKCFRDEDLRADRQPEFTQIDIEMSFAEEEDVWALVEGLVEHLWREVMGKPIQTPFPRLTYHEAMSRYGSDKPDTRFGMEIIDVSGALEESSFGVFRSALGEGGTVRALLVPGKASATRAELDDLSAKARSFGAKGLVSVAYVEGGIRSPVKKHLSAQEIASIAQLTGAAEGDLVLLVAAPFDTAVSVLGRLRLILGSNLGLIPNDRHEFLWVTDFPLLKQNEETGEWEAAHHPFTSPSVKDLPEIINGMDDSEKGRIHARMYDLVMNGVELASGSVRIYQREIQEKVFALIGMSADEARARFGFLLDAFDYGAPPHCGIAFGLDRLVMLMAGRDSIRDVIAFPKTLNAGEPMTDAPAAVDPQQLADLGICLKKGN